MRTTIEKVRAAVVVGAALVAAIVAGFLGLAHYRVHRLLGDLPARLDADIQKETNGYTYSQSVKGRTVFTLHAAKATQHKDGRTGLEDVGIVLYGQKDGRADRIYGKQFEYDQKNGVVRAMGEVQLDLQAPAPGSATERAEAARGGGMGRSARVKNADAQPIHVVTSGLVYVQRLGVASTDQPIRFEYRGMTGQARGAAYNSDTGVTTLESEVKLSTLREGRPTVLTATHAELDRVNHRVTLATAHYVALADGESDRDSGESLTAGRLVVHLGEGGGIEGAEGSDGVEMASRGSRMQAPNGMLRVNAEGRPERAQMTGGVRFASEQMAAGRAGDVVEGTAAAGAAEFDARGSVEAVRLSGGVQARSQETGVETARTLSGDAMELHLVGRAGTSRRFLQQVALRGQAQVQSALPAEAGHAAGSEEMRADVLVGQWQQAGGASVLRAMTGTGRTEIRRSRDGVEEVSRGDTLQAAFGAVSGDGSAGRRPGGRSGVRAGITAATQMGSVAIERVVQAAAKSKGGTAATGTETMRARAQRASYDAVSGHVTLTGETEIADAESVLRAEQVMMTESTGDAEAAGSVQVTYRQAAASRAGEMQAGARPEAQASSPGAGATPEPIHAVAERAVLHKETGIATFFGTPTLRARLWQGGSQVEAPVLVFGREEGTLDAYGAGAGDAMPVRTVLVSRAGASAAVAAKQAEKPQVLRVQSGRLHYADALRRAEFKGGVVLEDADGTMRSREAVATLASAAAKTPVGPTKTDAGSEAAKGKAKVAGLGGLSGAGLERVTAVGDVEVRQPGRLATGQQAVYTAADGMFVLTGGGGVLPKVTDDGNGSVTGAVLRFRSGERTGSGAGNGTGDNSVMVEGRAKDGTGLAKGETAAVGDGRVHTRTKVKQ